jgi:multicomponent Na+:H+ antiporter subunit F
MIYYVFMGILTFCCFLCLYRIYRGPSAPDRTVAVDIMGVLVVGFCALLALTSAQGFLMDIAIAWTLQSYVAVLALAKYLEGKHFNE